MITEPAWEHKSMRQAIDRDRAASPTKPWGSTSYEMLAHMDFQRSASLPPEGTRYPATCEGIEEAFRAWREACEGPASRHSGHHASP